VEGLPIGVQVISSQSHPRPGVRSHFPADGRRSPTGIDTTYSFLRLKEYNAAHEPTHIYWQFCCGYPLGFTPIVYYSGFWEHRPWWGC
jgi:hypothetical protein